MGLEKVRFGPVHSFFQSTPLVDKHALIIQAHIVVADPDEKICNDVKQWLSDAGFTGRSIVKRFNSCVTTCCALFSVCVSEWSERVRPAADHCNGAKADQRRRFLR